MADPVLDPAQWPRYVFHRTEPPRAVATPQEEAALGEGWQRTPFAPEAPAVAEEPEEPEPVLPDDAVHFVPPPRRKRRGTPLADPKAELKRQRKLQRDRASLARRAERKKA
jgi:hypothetical protein